MDVDSSEDDNINRQQEEFDRREQGRDGEQHPINEPM